MGVNHMGNPMKQRLRDGISHRQNDACLPICPILISGCPGNRIGSPATKRPHKANMDLSAFFSAYGALSYGGINDVAAYTLCQQALENHGNYYTLHYTTMKDGHFCPIVFRSYAVYASRGLLTDLTPSRNNVFYYSIGKTMEEAYMESN